MTVIKRYSFTYKPHTGGIQKVSHQITTKEYSKINLHFPFKRRDNLQNNIVRIKKREVIKTQVRFKYKYIIKKNHNVYLQHEHNIPKEFFHQKKRDSKIMLNSHGCLAMFTVRQSRVEPPPGIKRFPGPYPEPRRDAHD